MFFRRLILVLLVVGAGCGPKAVKRACVGGSAGPLVTDAAMSRLDVYDASAQCIGGVLAPGAGAPLLSHTYPAGQPIKLDVPPGPHTLVLTTYADAAGTMPLGQGCVQANLSAGGQLCFDLTVAELPDAGADLAACGPSNPACQCATDQDCTDPTLPRCAPNATCVACLPTNDNCPLNHYCDPTTDTCNSGCKSNAECAQLAGTDGGVPTIDTLCDTTRHMCVQCVSNADCPDGKLCSAAGSCVPGCNVQLGKLCPVGLTCCNNLCIDTTSDPFNCNGCGNVCNNGNTICCAGMCKNPQTDPDNCSGCGVACSSNHMATRTCSGGSCNGTCAVNWGDCDNNKLTNGCETDLTSTTANCGACGMSCTTLVQNATGAACSASACTYTSCNTNFGDCDGNKSNGCETNLTNTTTHCGACNINCNSTELNATGASCASSKCNYVSCSSTSFGDCDGNRTNGCETPLTTTSNCGGCGNACDTLHSIGAACGASGCTYTGCVTNYADCITTSPDTNGCETNITTDVNNCGACTRACSTSNVATRQCTGGLCNSTCNSGWGNCNQPAAGATAPYTPDDGCESNLNTCTATACCSQASPTPAGMCAPPPAHSDGFGHLYADCHALGVPGTASYTQQMALEAAAVDTSQNGSVIVISGSSVLCCNCGTPNEIDSVCKSTNGTLNPSGTWSCSCWSYSASGNQVSLIGTVQSGTTQCPCPSAGNATFN